MPMPRVVIFDVNETLSDLSGMARHLEAVGADPGLAPTWFAGLLRDGFALTAAGTNPPFADVGTAVLAGLLAAAGHPAERAEADAAAVTAGLADLPLHPDVEPGIERLADAGITMVTLTNGAPDVADRLLQAAGLRGHLDRLLSVADAPAWKPAPAAYTWALDELGLQPDEALLVAVHPWDIHGAGAAGLRTCWVNRREAAWPAVFGPPEVEVTGIDGILAAVDPA